MVISSSLCYRILPVSFVKTFFLREWNSLSLWSCDQLNILAVLQSSCECSFKAKVPISSHVFLRPSIFLSFSFYTCLTVFMLNASFLCQTCVFGLMAFIFACSLLPFHYVPLSTLLERTWAYAIYHFHHFIFSTEDFCERTTPQIHVRLVRLLVHPGLFEGSIRTCRSNYSNRVILTMPLMSFTF